ncbi:hypothetical protein B0919_00375 [Hymenobacter sp. CRA2]|nr:hypothetical protein B0919_00375 [Hymenobacter sp. CRA2]
MPTWLPFDEMLCEVLDVSITGLIFYAPIYDPAGSGSIVDFRFVYLNPAAQRMMRMPARPTLTHLQQWPHSKEHRAFEFHVEAYVTGEPRSYDVNYQADGYDNYYRLTARRAGEGLLVSFTDTADQPRTPVEVALRESQAREKAARAEVEAQRQQLQSIFHQAPVAIALLDGPDYRIALANPPVCEIWARTQAQVVDLPLFEALPEVRGQGLEELLEGVLRTGQPYVGTELPIQLLRHGRFETVYFNFVYHPQQNEQGDTVGILVVASDVTDMVLARRRVEEQEYQTSQLNEELAAANEEIRANNDELAHSQFDLQRLNQELEARVQERTRAALALQAEVLQAAQRQAQERETFFQIFAQTPASIALLHGPQHHFAYVNAAYQALFPGRELVGRPLAEALPDAAAQGFLDLLDGVYRSGETFFGTELPLAIAQPGGRQAKQTYFTFTYQAYHEEGEVVGVSIFAYDVTEQVRARQQRESLQQQLHDLFMQAPAPIVILDGPELVYQLVNPAYQRIFPGRELLHHALLEALPELADSPIPEMLRQVYETGQTCIVQELPLMLARHEGAPLEEVICTFTYQARHNAQGAVDGVFVFAQDITAQVLARRAVETREASFRLLADNVPGTLWVTDADGQCTYLNQRWYATTGQTEAEALGLGWANAVHPEDAPAARAEFIRANAQRQPYRVLFRLRQHSGQYRWVTDHGLPRFNESGLYEGMVGTVIDVHEQKLAELAMQRLTRKLRTSRDEAQALNTELQDKNQQLTRTNVDLDNFIYTASHDLKAPISNIEGLLYLLRGELPEAVAQDEYVDATLTRMLDSVERFKRTIEHLTEVSKLQKEHSPPSTAVELAPMVEEVRLDLASLLQQANARLHVDVAGLPAVLISEKNLRSVVYNLLSNAVKFHAPGRQPVIRVQGQVDAGYTVLEVQDNGLGIDDVYLPKLFTMFQRFHDHVQGTGVGLFMVKRIVENAGGRIEVRSEAGVGSTFSVALPHVVGAKA